MAELLVDILHEGNLLSPTGKQITMMHFLKAQYSRVILEHERNREQIFRIFNELHLHVMSRTFGVMNKKGGVSASFLTAGLKLPVTACLRSDALRRAQP